MGKGKVRVIRARGTNDGLINSSTDGKESSSVRSLCSKQEIQSHTHEKISGWTTKRWPRKYQNLQSYLARSLISLDLIALSKWILLIVIQCWAHGNSADCNASTLPSRYASRTRVHLWVLSAKNCTWQQRLADIPTQPGIPNQLVIMCQELVQVYYSSNPVTYVYILCHYCEAIVGEFTTSSHSANVAPRLSQRQ